MSVRLGISVEGQTEERFVKDLLASHLAAFGVFAEPVIVSTSRSASGKKAKGGSINIDRAANELKRLLPNYQAVTSFYDFYGFESKLSQETVEQLETRIAASLGAPPKLIPYVQRYEFEALLLSHAPIVASYFNATQLAQVIAAVVASAGSPENVNDSSATAPSKRMENWTRDYAPPSQRYSKATKTLHGPQLAKRLTLPVIRAACPRFNAWLTRLERLPNP